MKKFIKFFKSILNSVLSLIKENPDVKKFIKKHNRIYNFLQKRMEIRNFWGLPFTLSFLLFIYIFFKLIEIIFAILNSAPISFIDEHINNLAVTYSNPILLKFFQLITLLVNWQNILIGGIIFSLILLILKYKNFFAGFLAGLTGSGVLSYLIKMAIHRPRPAVGIFEAATYSFPSSHAVLSVFFLGFICYFLIKISKKFFYKILSAIFASIIILLIGFSRIYIGFHYLSDVIGGYLIGALFLVASISLTEYLEYRRPSAKAVVTKNKKLLICFLCAAEVVFLIIFFIIYSPAPKINDLNIIKKAETNNLTDLFLDKGTLPKYSETPTSQHQEPLSFLILAPNDGILIKAFEEAGWYLADPPTSKSLFNLSKAALLNLEYLNAPLTPSFWNGRSHTWGFEMPTEKTTVRQRHHCRIWKTNIQMPDNSFLYTATASFDEDMKWMITHKINPNIDQEREFLFESLNKSEKIRSYQIINFTDPGSNKNFSGDLFYTDGKAYIIIL